MHILLSHHDQVCNWPGRSEIFSVYHPQSLSLVPIVELKWEEAGDVGDGTEVFIFWVAFILSEPGIG